MEEFFSFFESSSITSTSAGDDATVVFTVPTKFEAEVTLLLLSSGDTGSSDTNIQIKRGSTYSFLLRKFSLGANTSKNVLEGGSTLHLRAGDVIVAHRNANALDLSVSGKLIFREAE